MRCFLTETMKILPRKVDGYTQSLHQMCQSWANQTDARRALQVFECPGRHPFEADTERLGEEHSGYVDLWRADPTIHSARYPPQMDDLLQIIFLKQHVTQ